MRHVQEEQAQQGHVFSVYCVVRKMESDEEVVQVCAAIVLADALLEKPKKKIKRYVNDYLLERTTKGSYGGLLT